jgi:histone deacetylase 1/2
LYGLRQAPRSWFSRLTDQLLQYGFVGSKSDPSLYILQTASFQLLILIYVDDIIVTGSHFEEVNKLISYLGRAFPVKDLGPSSYFLRVETLHDGGDLILTQRKYVINLLRRLKLHKVKPCSTPMSTTCTLSKFEGIDFDDPYLYRSTVSALHYLGFTQPDIAFAVHKVSKFMHQPKDVLWQAVKRILRYLKYTVNYGLHITHQSDHTLQGFSDADWAGDNDDRRSVGAYCIFHGSNLIS